MQEYKGLLSPRRTTTYNPKTNIVVDVVEIEVVAKSRTAIPRIDVPRTTAQYLNITALTCPNTVIFRRIYIIIMPIVLTPFPNIPVHIV